MVSGTISENRTPPKAPAPKVFQKLDLGVLCNIVISGRKECAKRGCVQPFRGNLWRGGPRSYLARKGPVLTCVQEKANQHDTQPEFFSATSGHEAMVLFGIEQGSFG